MNIKENNLYIKQLVDIRPNLPYKFSLIIGKKKFFNNLSYSKVKHLIQKITHNFSIIVIIILGSLSFIPSIFAVSLEEIEASLTNPPNPNIDKIKREDLPTLEDKKKENSLNQAVSLNLIEYLYKPKAQIIILNKITAKSELVEFSLNKPHIFGNLSIEVMQCIKNTDPIKQSNLMFIIVLDNKIKENKSPIFKGWMDSSNLSIATVEHPVYEIIPKNCID